MDLSFPKLEFTRIVLGVLDKVFDKLSTDDASEVVVVRLLDINDIWGTLLTPLDVSVTVLAIDNCV